MRADDENTWKIINSNGICVAVRYFVCVCINFPTFSALSHIVYVITYLDFVSLRAKTYLQCFIYSARCLFSLQKVCATLLYSTYMA